MERMLENAVTTITAKRIVGVSAPNRDTLREAVDAYLPEGWDGHTYLQIDLTDCGNSRAYPKRTDVPNETVPCNCGAGYEHYFILYEGKERGRP